MKNLSQNNRQTGMAQNKRLIAILLIATGLLLVPLVAMQFTTEVAWTLSDFIIMGVMLYGTGLACEWILRKVRKPAYRLAVCAVVLFAFLLTWAELAVGIFGTPLAGS